MSEGITKRWVIQSVILSKKKFKNVEAARKWCRDHGFKTSHKGKGVDETSTSWRFRQRDPEEFSRFRTIQMTDGVSAVYGELVTKKSDETQGLKWAKEFLGSYFGSISYAPIDS